MVELEEATCSNV